MESMNSPSRLALFQPASTFWEKWGERLLFMLTAIPLLGYAGREFLVHGLDVFIWDFMFISWVSVYISGVWLAQGASPRLRVTLTRLANVVHYS